MPIVRNPSDTTSFMMGKGTYIENRRYELVEFATRLAINHDTPYKRTGAK